MENNEQDRLVFLNKYLDFKQTCIDRNIFELDEIIKLFEVWLHLLE